MRVCDFHQAFLHFCIDLARQPAITVSQKQPFTVNHVRIPIDCRCRLGDTTYVLTDSCKTERVNVAAGVWMNPNADFCAIVSDQHFLLLKRFARCGQTAPNEIDPGRPVQLERQSGLTADAWAEHRVDLPEVEGRELPNAAAVYAAIKANRQLVAQTEYALDDGTPVCLEYPVRTINVSDRDDYYQVDTGPVLFADIAPDAGLAIDGFRLAYIAHNSPTWAEFVVNVPTPVADDVCVDHYAQSRRVATTANRMIEVQA